ncbi:hypothetical protein ACFWTC_37055 [Streptomyces sp. NPDC058619]|uniref:hypothetical protein n=1 Tax=unclassified Streptomyces TaxID=2593676 RepID=UPI00366A3B6A
MKHIARGLTLACMTAALLTPVAGTASAAPQTQVHDDRRKNCDCRDKYNDYDYDYGRWSNGYYGGGIGLGLGLIVL